MIGQWSIVAFYSFIRSVYIVTQFGIIENIPQL